jgi:ribosomal protein S18 acetylase RimI-like enzyme
MAEFYAEAGYRLNRPHAAKAFAALLSDERLGRVWLIEAGSEEVGYVVLTLGYSMEFGGLDAFVDDLFIQAPFRHHGLGTAAVAEAKAYSMELGVRALHLEVGRDNAVAQAVYRRAGFILTDRQLMTVRLADPSHFG